MPHIPTLPTTSRIPDYNTLIFDLGDVIFTYALDSSTQRPSSISPKVLRATLSSKLWGDYEKGLVDEENCYIQASSAVQVNPDDLRMALEEARSSLVFTPEMISLLRELQSRGIKLYAMSNISHPDFQYLSSKFDLTIFERVYTSCEAHERKPELSFYRRVLEDIGEDPKRIIFVDDKVENVLSASSFGIHGIVFDNPKTLRRDLLNLLEDPVSRAKEYLKLHQGQLDTVTETGVSFKDNFSQLLIYEWTGDWNLVRLVKHQSHWNFFQGKGAITNEYYPNDLDTTSIGLTVIDMSEEIVQSVIEHMLEYQTPDGIMLTYFDKSRVHFDPIVCVNVLHLFYRHGQGHRLERTLDWVYSVLLNRAYINGTRYYATPETFLFFLVRFLRNVPKDTEPQLHSRFVPLIKERAKELIGSKGDPLAHAMRVLVCDFVGIFDEKDIDELVRLQCEDGSWEPGWIYKYGKTGLLIGNRGLTTALAMRALQVGQRDAL